MIGGTPRRPSGNDPEAIWAQWVWDMITKVLPVRDSSTVKSSVTTRGTFLTAAPAGAPATAAPAATVSKFVLASVQGDILMAYAFADGTLTSIAKSPKLKTSITQEIIDGNTITYSSASYSPPKNAWRRNATINGVVIRQEVIPYWLFTGNLIPGGVSYSGNLYTLNGLIPGNTYVWLKGANDRAILTGGPTLTSSGAFIAVNNFATLNAIGSPPVTAQVFGGDVIHAVQPSGGGFGAATWQDLNIDARAWSVRTDQST